MLFTTAHRTTNYTLWYNSICIQIRKRHVCRKLVDYTLCNILVHNLFPWLQIGINQWDYPNALPPGFLTFVDTPSTHTHTLILVTNNCKGYVKRTCSKVSLQEEQHSESRHAKQDLYRPSLRNKSKQQLCATPSLNFSKVTLCRLSAGQTE